jgi:hypothetical protein
MRWLDGDSEMKFFSKQREVRYDEEGKYSGVLVHFFQTVGKVYKVLGDRVSSTDAVFSIINDIGKQGNYYHGRFEMLEESRERKLKKILDEHN